MAARQLCGRLQRLHLPPTLQSLPSVLHGQGSLASLSSSSLPSTSSSLPEELPATLSSSPWLRKLKGFFVGQDVAESTDRPVSPSVPPASQHQLSLEAFADELKKARAFGKLAHFGRGLPRGGEAIAASSLEKQENILRKLASYNRDGQHLEAKQKSIVASECGCTARDVDDVLNKYEWAKEANARMQRLKEEGKPVPTTMDGIQKLMGGGWNGAASVNLAKDGQPSRNSLCPCGSGKKYKRCVKTHPPYPWRPPS